MWFLFQIYLLFLVVFLFWIFNVFFSSIVNRLQSLNLLVTEGAKLINILLEKGIGTTLSFISIITETIYCTAKFDRPAVRPTLLCWSDFSAAELDGLLCHADSVWAELPRRTDLVSSGPCFVCWFSSLRSQWVNRGTCRHSDLFWEFPAFSWHVAEQVCGHLNQQYRASSVSGFMAPPIFLKVWSVEWIFYHLRSWRMGHSDGRRHSPLRQVSSPFYCAVLCWSQILGVHPKGSMFSYFSSRRFPWWQYCIGSCCCPCCRQANVMFVTNKHQVKNSSSHSKQTPPTIKGKLFEWRIRNIILLMTVWDYDLAMQSEMTIETEWRLADDIK